MTSFTPYSYKYLTSSSIELTGLDLSLPLVKGTIQNEHILLHPLIIDIHACLLLLSFLTGIISAYVSSNDNYTFIGYSSLSLFSRIFNSLGRSL